MFERFLHPPVLAIGIPDAVHQMLSEKLTASDQARTSESETTGHA